MRSSGWACDWNARPRAFGLRAPSGRYPRAAFRLTAASGGGESIGRCRTRPSRRCSRRRPPAPRPPAGARDREASAQLASPETRSRCSPALSRPLARAKAVCSPYHHGRDQERDQHGEPQGRQDLTQSPAAAGRSRPALEHHGGTEVRQHQRRIDPRQEPNDQNHAEDGGHQPRITPIVGPHRMTGDVALSAGPGAPPDCRRGQGQGRVRSRTCRGIAA